MGKAATNKTSPKKASGEKSSEEVVTQEEKITKDVKGEGVKKADDTPGDVGESGVSENQKILDTKDSLTESGSEDPSHTEKESEDTSDVNSGAESNGHDSDSTSEDYKRSTVYGDDFDAVRVEKQFSMSRLLLFILIIVTSAAVFFTGMILYQSNKDNFVMPSLPFDFAPTPTPTEAPTPTPSPTPEIVYSDFTVEVLNGSGISGAAGAVAGILEGEGFEDVQVGNASDSDYSDTEVQMKEDVPSEVFEAIAKVLSDYTVVEGDELDTGDDFDIIITVGQPNE